MEVNYAIATYHYGARIYYMFVVFIGTRTARTIVPVECRDLRPHLRQTTITIASYHCGARVHYVLIVFIGTINVRAMVPV